MTAIPFQFRHVIFISKNSKLTMMSAIAFTVHQLDTNSLAVHTKVLNRNKSDSIISFSFDVDSIKTLSTASGAYFTASDFGRRKRIL